MSGDVQARLLLATLLRRTKRWPEAREQLETLSRLEAAANWEFEIADELERLAAAEEQATIEVGGETHEHQTAQTPPAMLPAA